MKRDEQHAGLIASAAYNPHVEAKFRVNPADWFPKDTKPEPERDVTPEMHRISLEAWAAAGFGRITAGELDA